MKQAQYKGSKLELETDKILAEIDSGIGWVTFNNPERRNAISLEMWDWARRYFGVLPI